MLPRFIAFKLYAILSVVYFMYIIKFGLNLYLNTI